MNLERIKSTLGKTTGVFGWLLRQQTMQETSVLHLPNLYTVENDKFVRSSNPYPREVISMPGEEIRITVYAKFKANGNEYMGEATDQILSDDESALNQSIQSLLTNARSQRNKPFSLPDKSLTYRTDIKIADPLILKSTKPQLIDLVAQFNQTIIDSTNQEKMVDVSNIELFIKNHHNVLYTSTGIAVEFDSTRADTEICFIARLSDDRVAEATARSYTRRFDDLKPDDLVKTYAAYARSIAQASTPSQYTGPVVIVGEALADVLSLDKSPLIFQANARTVYDKMSRFEQDKPVTGDFEIKGDHITISSDPHTPFGPNSHVFSVMDCSPSRSVMVVKDGNYAELFGTRRYYEYLGLLEKGILSSGPLGNTFIQAGKVSANQLIGPDKVVVIKMFSDWTSNPVNGDFACEIRLGEIHENDKAKPFKGGLLVGNYFKMLSDITLSKETIQLGKYFGPASARFENLQVTG
jgi:predicted Zn-dependent protease